ncbi:MAG: hypothetical protein ACREAM_23365 [Blastocatellia bacterium]
MRGMSGSTWGDAKSGMTAGIFPFPAFELLQKNSGAVFSSLFAYYPTRKANVMVKGQAELVGGEFVSGDYFRGLALSPAAGRLIHPDDDRVGAPPGFFGVDPAAAPDFYVPLRTNLLLRLRGGPGDAKGYSIITTIGSKSWRACVRA